MAALAAPRPRHTARVAVLAIVLGSGTARATEVRTVARTVGEGYMVRAPGPEGELLSRRRLVQYVNLGVFELLPPREPDQTRRDHKDGQLQLVSSMRLRHDFGTLTQRASGQAQDLTETLDGRQIDLLFGYLEGRNLGGWVDLRAGRQFEMSGLDWYAFDGGWVKVRTPAHLAFEVMGGFQVDGSDVFGYPTFELDGTSDTPADDALSPMVGAAVGLDSIRWLDARIAYRRTWSPASLNRGIVNEDGSEGLPGAVDQEVFSSTFALRLLSGAVTPYGAARYNLGTNRVDDVSAGLAWAITPLHTVRTLYIRTIPAFDLDSIFNVFSLTPFEDLRVVYEVRPGRRWRLLARGQARLFRSETTAELGTEPADPLEVGAGGGGAAVYQRRRFAVRLDGFGLGGEGGLRAGGSLDTRTHVWWDRIALDGRTYFLYYRDEVTDDRRGYSLALQAGTNFRLWQGIYLNLVAEELFSPFLRHAFRALAIFSLDWSFRVGQR